MCGCLVGRGEIVEEETRLEEGVFEDLWGQGEASVDTYTLGRRWDSWKEEDGIVAARLLLLVHFL